jgi:hypothetical protein
MQGPPRPSLVPNHAPHGVDLLVCSGMPATCRAAAEGAAGPERLRHDAGLGRRQGKAYRFARILLSLYEREAISRGTWGLGGD